MDITSPSKILSKILPKFFPTPSKSLQNRVPNRYWIPHAFQNRPERDFFDFLLIVGTSGTSQNRAKIAKKTEEKRTKNGVEKSISFNHDFFYRFLMVWASQNGAKFEPL